MNLLPLAPEPFTAPADRDMLPSERREFVRTHRTCVFGYARRQDGPAMSVVYYIPTDDDARPFVAEMAADENRVVLRCRPYATFATPPRHLHANDQDESITHWLSSSIPWDAEDPE